MSAAVMRALSPLSYWLALGYLRWATSRRFGRVHALHPDAPEVGTRIVRYEMLLGVRGRKGMVRL